MDILQSLREQLQSERGIDRVDAAVVIGLVQETQLYDAMRQAFSAEKNAKVKKNLKWAGQRLNQAKKANYSTIETIWDVFRVQREVDKHFQTKEDKLLKSITDTMSMQSVDDSSGLPSASMAAGALLGGLAFGPGATVGGMMGGTGNLMSSDLKGTHETIEKRRTPPMHPSDMNINIHLKRLQNTTNPDKQRQLMIDLAGFNNPAALPVMAKIHLISPSGTVRQTAEEAAKSLYLMVRYWELDQAGEIQRMIDEAIEAAQ